MNTTIVIKDLRIYARHGVMPQEQLTGDYFTINLRLGFDFPKAMKSDRLEDTLDYSAVVKTVRQEMEIPSNLLEHAGNRICCTLFDRFANVMSIDLELIKENPPMGVECKGAGIRLQVERAERNILHNQ